MKKTFTAPEMSISRFDFENVVTSASGGVILALQIMLAADLIRF